MKYIYKKLKGKGPETQDIWATLKKNVKLNIVV